MHANIRYSFGGDEHLFAEVAEAMSLEAFFRGMAITRAIEALQLPGVLDVCLANASFRSASTPTGWPRRRCWRPCAAWKPRRSPRAASRRVSSKCRCCTTIPGPTRP